MELTEEPFCPNPEGCDKDGGKQKEKSDVELRLSLRVMCLSNKNSEHHSTPEKLYAQETSSCDILDINSGKDASGNSKDLILESDIDVNEPSTASPHKGIWSKLADCATETYCKIVCKLLDNVGTPMRLQCIGVYLMMTGNEEAYAELKDDKDTKVDHDSGIHSGSEHPRPTSLGQAQPHGHLVDGDSDGEKNVNTAEQNLESGCQKGSFVKKKDGEQEPRVHDEDDDEDDDGGGVQQERNAAATLNHVSSTIQLRAQTYVKRLPFFARPVSAGVGWAHIPALPTSLGYGGLSSQAETKHLNNASQHPSVSTGTSFRSLERNQRSSSYQGISLGSQEDLLRFVKEIGQAQVDEGVFIEKVPLIFEERFRKYSLHRPQQVDLVIVNQDSCPWDGLAKVYGLVKRKLRDKEFGEIFMEFCKGNTMLHNIRFLEILDVADQLKYAKQLVDVVKYLHDPDIIHGDLKLENVGMRENGLALIDFEGAKHPSYPMNTRGTLLYMPPWFRQCVCTDFKLLKTLDMWAVGVILLRVRFGQFMFAREYASLRNCDTCGLNNAACNHRKDKFLNIINNNYEVVQEYLPMIEPSHGPLERLWVCLIHGLLSARGPEAQLTAEDAAEALEGDSNIIVQVLKNGCQTIPPLVVQKGVTVKTLVSLPKMEKLKLLHEDLRDGMWFSRVQETPRGYRQTNVDLNLQLMESCVLEVHAPLPSQTL